jgi:uncharacterized protein (DUF362 family)
MDVSRRGFLKAGTAAGFISGPLFTGKVYAAENGDIGVAKGTNIEAVIKAAVDAVGGFEAYVPKGSRVIIKPNLSFASPPERATTTNPEVLRAVIKHCLDAGAKQVLVVDNPLQDSAIIGSKSLVAQVVKDAKNATLILPTTENLFEEAVIPRAKEMKSTKTAKILKEANVLISLPVAKSHSATGVSLGIKGNLGLVYDRIAYHNSGDFNQSIADLATIIKPNLTIVDAIRALTTRGPQGPGKVVDLNTIVAGSDPVAVDSYAVSLTPWYNKEFKGSNIIHLVKSSEMGLGEIDPSKLKIISKTV